MSKQINDLKKLLDEMSEVKTNLPAARGNLIPYSAPASLPKCSLVEMSVDISFLVLPSAADRVIIWNKFAPSAKIDYHYHDCWEQSRVLEGSILYQDREYCVGEVIIIQPFLRHEIQAGANGGVLIVELLNPDFN